MRAILLILIVAVIAVIGAIQLGLIDISQTQPARAPSISAGNGVIRAEAGQAPKFDVETGSVGVGTTEANVALPKVEITKSDTTVKVPAVEVRSPPKPVDQKPQQ